jgi:hypothetical protein
MTKLGILGAALVASSLLAAPVMARQAVVYPDPYAYRARCAHHQLGNPYTPEQDYIAWSAWRSRGSWAEPAFDPACSRVSHSYRSWPGY